MVVGISDVGGRRSRGRMRDRMEEYAVGVIDGVRASWGACMSASD
jgi:hypothetical protein